MTYRRVVTISQSGKQKFDTRISKNSELVGSDNMSTIIFKKKEFMEAQGFDVNKNIILQDNKSTI